MSELVERVDKHMKKFFSNYEGTGPLASVATNEEHHPGLVGIHELVGRELASAASVVYHEHCGVHYNSMSELFEVLSREYAPLVRRVLVLALVFGMEIGEGTSPQVRWYRAAEKTNEVFENKHFRNEVELRMMSLLGDEELSSYVSTRLREGATVLATMTGYRSEPDSPRVARKSWNIWYLTARSLASAMYLAGVTMGEENKEVEAFRGIISASEEDRDA